MEGENEHEEEGSVSEASEIGTDAPHLGDAGLSLSRVAPIDTEFLIKV